MGGVGDEFDVTCTPSFNDVFDATCMSEVSETSTEINYDKTTDNINEFDLTNFNLLNDIENVEFINEYNENIYIVSYYSLIINQFNELIQDTDNFILNRIINIKDINKIFDRYQYLILFIKQNILHINLTTEVNDIDNKLNTLIFKWNLLKRYVISNKYKL